jgi:uncharacterized protein YuzB (UPF0349 family)
MAVADKYDDLYLIACCIERELLDLIEEDPILEVPKYGGITHAGEGFCCDSLWIMLQPLAIAGDFVPGQDKCASSVTERFDIVWGIPACSEGAFFTDCDQSLERCYDDETEGCPEPDHAIGDGQCGEGERPSVLQETAYIWRARSLLRRELACRVQCCASGDGGCVSVRCQSIRATAINEVTEGGCSYLTLTLEVKL